MKFRMQTIRVTGIQKLFIHHSSLHHSSVHHSYKEQRKNKEQQTEAATTTATNNNNNNNSNNNNNNNSYKGLGTNSLCPSCLPSFFRCLTYHRGWWPSRKESEEAQRAGPSSVLEILGALEADQQEKMRRQTRACTGPSA